MTSMKDFIPYEQALELKELGFNEPCFGLYAPPSKTIFLHHYGLLSAKEQVLAPLYQQAIRWFREKYSLHAPIGEESDWEENNESWSFDIYKYKLGNNDAMISNCETFNTYEEAELECLIKLIEIVKTK